MNSPRYLTPKEAARTGKLKKFCGGNPELMEHVDRACKRMRFVQALEADCLTKNRKADDRRRKAISRGLKRIAGDLSKDMTSTLRVYQKHVTCLHPEPKEAMQAFADKQLGLWLEELRIARFNRPRAGTLTRLALKGRKPQLTVKNIIIHIHRLCKEASGLTDNAVSKFLAWYLDCLGITKKNGSPYTRHDINHYIKI